MPSNTKLTIQDKRLLHSLRVTWDGPPPEPEAWKQAVNEQLRSDLAVLEANLEVERKERLDLEAEGRMLKAEALDAQLRLATAERKRRHAEITMLILAGLLILASGWIFYQHGQAVGYRTGGVLEVVR